MLDLAPTCMSRNVKPERDTRRPSWHTLGLSELFNLVRIGDRQNDKASTLGFSKLYVYVWVSRPPNHFIDRARNGFWLLKTTSRAHCAPGDDRQHWQGYAKNDACRGHRGWQCRGTPPPHGSAASGRKSPAKFKMFLSRKAISSRRDRFCSPSIRVPTMLRSPKLCQSGFLAARGTIKLRRVYT